MAGTSADTASATPTTEGQPLLPTEPPPKAIGPPPKAVEVVVGEQEAHWTERAAALGLFFLIGPVLIWVNRRLLVDKRFEYPALLCSTGVMFSGLFGLGCVAAGKAELPHREMVTGRFWMSRVMPIGFFLAMTLMTGNWAYMHLGVAYIQILKALAPVFLVGMLLFFKMEQPSVLLLSAVAIMVVGTLWSTTGELRFSVLGFVLMMSSEFCESAKLVCTQSLLSDCKFTTIEGMLYVCPAGCIWLWLISACTEADGLIHQGGLAIMRDNWGMFAFAGLLGIFINLAVIWVTKVCSALTLKVTSMARNMCIVLASPLLFGDVIMPSQLIGYMIASSGIVLYNYCRSNPEVVKSTTIASIIEWVRDGWIRHETTETS